MIPCSVNYDAITEYEEETTYASLIAHVLICTKEFAAFNWNNYDCDCSDIEKTSKWNNFVDGIRSKLTVKQVVDGVRSGGSLSFDYLLLIVTAE